MLKPFDFNDLYRRLANLLQKKKTPITPAKAAMRKDDHSERLYDLSGLRSLGDNESLLEIISLVLSSTFSEIQELPALAKEKNWPAVFKVAHKTKGALSVLQANSIIQPLAEIEKNAREENNLSFVEQQIVLVMELFAKMEIQLREEEAQLKKDLS